MIIFLPSFGVMIFCFILCSPKLSNCRNWRIFWILLLRSCWYSLCCHAIYLSRLLQFLVPMWAHPNWVPSGKLEPFTDYFSEKAQVVPDELRTAYLLMSPNITNVQFKDLPGNEEMFSHSSWFLVVYFPLCLPHSSETT